MGTTYGLWQGNNTEVTLDEMSNTLQLCIRGSDDNEICSERMTPEQVIDTALEMLKVSSYWSDDGTVERKIAEFKAKGYHW